MGRVRRSVHGQNALVLHIQEEDDATCEYLEQLVQKVMEVQYYLNGDRPRPSGLRGPVSWELARRVERNLRESQELKAISEELTADPPTDRVESRYRMGHHLGRWGVGEVFLASHLLLKRPVVIKVLPEELRTDEHARRRLEREATIPTKVTCPGIVDVIDFGEDGHGGLFYTMEALTGETLAALLERGERFSDRDVARLGVHLAAALVIAHLRGYGHYDLCPENVYLQKWSGGPAWPLLINVAGPPAEGTLEDSHPMGKDFWPPEAPRETVGPRHDVYGLGALLGHLREHASSNKKGQGPRLLRELIWQARTPSPDDRFPDMTVMARALVRCLEAPDLRAQEEQKPQIESPRDLKNMFGPGDSTARTYSTRLIAEAMATFANADPRAEAKAKPPARPSKPSKEVTAAAGETAGERQEADVPVITSAPPKKAARDDKPFKVARSVTPESKRSIPYPLILAVLLAVAAGVVIWKRNASKPPKAPAVTRVLAPRPRPSRPKQVKKAPATPKKEEPKLPPLDDPAEVQAGAQSDINPLKSKAPAAGATPDSSAAVPAPSADPRAVRRAAIKQARRLLKQKKHTEARQHLTRARDIRDSAKIQALFARSYEEQGEHA